MATDLIDDPSTRSEVLKKTEAALELIDTLLNGTEAMREASTTYLPMHPNESKKAYDARLSKATLFNGLEDAIDNAVSRIFDEQVRVEETAPEFVQEWMKDVDLKGTNLHDFGREAMEAAVADGIVHVLVDFPAPPVSEDGVTPVRFTLAEERQLGLRPYMTLVRHSDLIALYTERIGGQTIVTHVRFKETVTRRNGFGEETIERIRLLEPGYWAVYERQTSNNGSKAWVLESEGFLQKGENLLWDRVPFFTLRLGKRRSHDLDVKPPFLDLAYLNVRHWQSTADQYNILDTARFPMLAVSGFEGPIRGPSIDDDGDASTPQTPAPFTVGPNTVLTTGDPSGKWYYVEHGGASIRAGAEELEALEERMAIAGLEPLLTKHSGTQTATETAVDEAKSRAPLETWARQMGHWLEQAIAAMCEWMSVEVEIKVHINTEVGLTAGSSQDVSNLIQMRLMGEISRWTFYQELMRRGLLGPNFDPRIESARMELENPDDPGTDDEHIEDDDVDESDPPEDPDKEETDWSDPSKLRKSPRSRRRRRGRGGRGRSGGAQDRTLQ